MRYDDEFSARDYRRDHSADAWMRRQDRAVEDHLAKTAHPHIDDAERARLQRRLQRRNAVAVKRAAQ